MEALDHSALAKSRIVSEYRNKPKFQAWVDICPAIANEALEGPLQTIYNSYDVDSVNDELLDVIGRIVGIARPILRTTSTDVFGYEGNDSYTNYNVAPYIGSGDLTIDAPLNNDLYRKLVKAKIARNISDGTYDSIIQLTEFILGFSVTALVDNGDMSFQLGLEREPDNGTDYLINNFDIIPRPQGVELKPYFILPKNIDEIERTSTLIYNYSNYTLPGDLA